VWQDSLDVVEESPRHDGPFVAFYRQQYPGAVRLVYAFVPAEACEDVVQDAFARLYGRFGELDNPAGYLRVTLVNLCRELHRGRARERQRLANLDPLPTTVPPEASELLDVLQRLPYPYRAVLVLRYWAGWSEAEIAAGLGCRPGSVKSRASRALARLRRELER
jgi:RNA polymerase sigma factor (sigma-70 family)